MKKILLIITCCLVSFNQACADVSGEIKTINSKVAQLEKSKTQFNALELKLHTGEMESAPPEVMYYYRPADMSLVMIEVNVGHEIFTTRYVYYVENNHVIKYLKETINHPESPAKEAIIYNKDGSVLWKNTNEPAVSPKQAMEVFNQNVSAMKIFSKY